MICNDLNKEKGGHMKNEFAIGSIARTNEKISKKQSLFSLLKRRKGAPLFFARTISGHERIYDSEIEFLRENKCNILLVYRGLKKNYVLSKDGYTDAVGAAICAQEVGASPFTKIAIFAKIEPDWNINLRWMSSYVEWLLKLGYVPGFICSEEMYNSINKVYVQDELLRWVKPATSDPRVSFMLFDCKKKKRGKELKNNIDLKIRTKIKINNTNIDVIEVVNKRILKNLWDGEQIFRR